MSAYNRDFDPFRINPSTSIRKIRENTERLIRSLDAADPKRWRRCHHLSATYLRWYVDHMDLTPRRGVFGTIMDALFGTGFPAESK